MTIYFQRRITKSSTLDVAAVQDPRLISTTVLMLLWLLIKWICNVQSKQRKRKINFSAKLAVQSYNKSTNSFYSMFHFYTVRFYNVFRGYRNGTLV